MSTPKVEYEHPRVRTYPYIMPTQFTDPIECQPVFRPMYSTEPIRNYYPPLNIHKELLTTWDEEFSEIEDS